MTKETQQFNFEDLNLSEEMLATLTKLKFKTASEIQSKAIPVILEGKDIIGQAKTGTGKTAAFGIPIIEKTVPGKGIQHLVLVPSRELAKQIQDEFNNLTKHKKLKIINIIGGVSYDIQRRDINRNPDILIATPGRLIDHLESKKIPIDLSNVKTFTLDEADEMLNFGFYKEMLKIAKFLPKGKQTMLLTATFNKRTKELAKDLLNDPVSISASSGLSASETVKQDYVMVKEKNKLVTLYNLLQLNKHKQVIIFGRTRKRVDELSEALIRLGFKAKGIQGDMKQADRTRTMASFRQGKIKILIGTDVLARGIDVDTIDLIFNFDLPTEIEYYTHRIGRTGRAKREGRAISFVKDNELLYFKKILEKTSSKATKLSAPTDADMADQKAAQLDAELSRLLHLGREKYRQIGDKIATEYTIEHLGLIVAAATIGTNVKAYDLQLTGEASMEQKGGRSRSRGTGSNSRSRSSSRGRNRSGSFGGNSSGRSSRSSKSRPSRGRKQY